MAITQECETAECLDLQDYLEAVRHQVRSEDEDSVLASAPLLRMLANDRELIVRRLNTQIREAFRGEAADSAQVIILGRGPGFYVRANIWPSSADVASGRIYQDQFSYHLAHDHNYSFLTTNHVGPGYLTEIYEYDFDQVQGYIGERVDMRFLEKRHFSGNSVMYYRASKDLHTQFPPDELSITINLMLFRPDVGLRDQYFFDVEKRQLAGYPVELDGSRRTSIVQMAAQLADDNTLQLLADLSHHHPCRRTRLEAFRSMAAHTPAEQVWRKAAQDSAQLVRRAALAELEALSRGSA